MGKRGRSWAAVLAVALCGIGGEGVAGAAPGELAGVYRSKATLRPPEGNIEQVIPMGDIVAAVAGGRAVVGIAPAVGRVAWAWKPTAGRVERIVRAGGALVAIADDIVRLDPASGKVLWLFPRQCLPATGCQVHVFDVTPRGVLLAGLGAQPDSINVLDLASGEPRFPQWVPSGPVARGHLVGDTIVTIGARAPWPVGAWNARTGRPLWALGAGLGGSRIEGSAIVDGDLVVWTVPPVELAAISLADGAVHGRMTLGQARVSLLGDTASTAGNRVAGAGLAGKTVVSWQVRGTKTELLARTLPDARFAWRLQAALALPPAVVGDALLLAVQGPDGPSVDVVGLADGTVHAEIPLAVVPRSLAAVRSGASVLLALQGAPSVLAAISDPGPMLTRVGPIGAPDAAAIQAVVPLGTSLAGVVAGGTWYALEVRPVASIAQDLRALLERGAEGEARALFRIAHPLVQTVPAAAILASVMANHEVMAAELNALSGAHIAAARAVAALADANHIYAVADIVAWCNAVADMLGRSLYPRTAEIRSTAGAPEAWADAVRAGLVAAERLGPALGRQPNAAHAVAAALLRMAFWLHVLGRTDDGLFVLSRVASAPWGKGEQFASDAFRGPMILPQAASLLEEARTAWRRREWVDAWAALRDLAKLPGLDTVLPIAAQWREQLEAVDPDTRAGRRTLRKLLKEVRKFVKGAQQRGAWTDAACQAECALGQRLCKARPCAEQRQCEADGSACRASCGGNTAPSWPHGHPAEPGTPQWWKCR